MKLDNPLTLLVKELLQYSKKASENQLVLMRKLTASDVNAFIKASDTVWEVACEYADSGKPISFTMALETNRDSMTDKAYSRPELQVRCGERYYRISLHPDAPGLRYVIQRLGTDFLYQEDISPVIWAWRSKNYADAVLPMEIKETDMKNVQETDVFVVADYSVWSVDSGRLVTVGFKVKQDPGVFIYKRCNYDSSELEIETAESDCEVLVAEFVNSEAVAIEYCPIEPIEMEWLLKLEKFYRDGRSNLPDEVFDNIMVRTGVSEESLQEAANETYGEKQSVGFNSIGVDSERGDNNVVYPAETKILSQEKVRDLEVLEKIANSWGGKSVISWKLDGVAVRLHYHGDKFVRAETKGKARDVTDLMRNVGGIPFTINHGRPFVEPSFKKDWFVTGELVAVNARRSVAAGYLLRKDFGSDKTKKIASELDFVVYDSNIFKFNSESNRVSSISLYSQMIELLWEAGFSCVQLFNYRYGCMEELKETAPSGYDTDGMVVRVNDIRKYANLGETSHHPKGSVAFKFEDVWHKAKTKRIYGRIGRGHVIKLICEFETIEINGKKISSAVMQPKDDGNWKLVYDCNINTPDYASNYAVLRHNGNSYVSLRNAFNVDEVEVCLRGMVIPQWRFID